MFNLVYRVDFEVFALLIAILLYIETRIQYPQQASRSRNFRIMTLLVIITDIFDLISAFTITYGSQVPLGLNVFINSGYFMSGLALCYMLQYYIQTAFVPPEGKAAFLKVNQYLLIFMEACFLPNIIWGFFFSFTPQGVYTHGPLYLALHLASCWFVLCASATLIVNHKIIKRDRVNTGFALVSLYFIAVVLQTFVFPDVFLIMPAVTVMLVITVFSLESPDYLQLQKTLQELSETKQELETANGKLHNLAYIDLMTGLKNRTAYDIRMEQLNVEAQKEQFIFLIADVNNLKGLNDHYGHSTGDDAIIKTAKLLEGSFGEHCQCYRIGGDEFAVISNELSETEFTACYQHFCASVREAKASASYPFAVAAGFQVVGSDTLLATQIRADENMYADKIAQKTLRNPFACTKD